MAFALAARALLTSLGSKQANVFFINAPESPGRWQLQVRYLREGRHVKLWRWYMAKWYGNWLDRLVPPRFKDVSQYHDSAISDWIEQRKN